VGRATRLAVGLTLGAGWLLRAQAWPDRTPVHIRRTGAFHGPPVTESSGATGSRGHPGRFWTINDSGNGPLLFLVDTLATISGTVRLDGATNVDWEALAGGPCGPAWCLYVGDIGDNRAIRRSVVIYRLLEPTDRDLSLKVVPVKDSLVVRYADQPHDAESLLATQGGDLAIITKGQEGESLEYPIPSTAWHLGSLTVRPRWRLPFGTSLLLGRLVTDAALSQDEQTLAVRTYREIFLFRRRPGGDLPDQPYRRCDIAGVDPQGEGLAWWNASTLLLTSESRGRRGGPITLLECPTR